MKKLLRFLSLAALTQLTLVVNQLAVLPAQLRMWGTDATAAWYSATAVAMLASVADLGLRAAAHAELLRCVRDPEDGDASAGSIEQRQEAEISFLRTWSWVRVLVVFNAICLVLGDLLVHVLLREGPYPLWRALLTVSMAAEALLVVRVMYMDTLGLYDKAELGYFVFSFVKAGVVFSGVLWLGWHETAIATVHALTVLMGILLQGWLCREVTLISLLSPLRLEQLRQTLILTVRTLSEPLSNWTRLSLPVLVLASIAPASAVTTYVALRALFGVVRASMQQVARMASYEFLRVAQEDKPAPGQAMLSGFLLAGSLFGAAFSFVFAADNQRLVRLWLGNTDHSIFLAIAIPFGLGAPFYIYQLLLSIRVRTDDLHAIANRQYTYFAFALAGSALGALSKSWTLYLWLMLACEVALSLFIMSRLNEPLLSAAGPASRRGFRAAAIWALVLGAFWLLVSADPYGVFSGRSLSAIGLSSLTTVLCLAAGMAGVAYLNRESLQALFSLGASRFRASKAEA